MSELRRTLLAADVARARRRRHKACTAHGRVKVVCVGCARIYCPRCTPECPACERPFKKGQKVKINGVKHAPHARGPETPVVVAPLWPDVKALGAVRIDTHEDSGGYVAVFPFPLNGVTTSGDLAQRFFDAMGSRVVKTPFGAGRWANPDLWYVTFTVGA